MVELVPALCRVSVLTLLVNFWRGDQVNYLQYAVLERKWEVLECLFQFPFSNEQLIDAIRWFIVKRHRKGHGILKKQAKKPGIVLERDVGVYR